MFKGKKIVITQGSLHGFSGSEIVTLELAEFFQKAGANVIVFSRYLGMPMDNEFKKRKIQTTTDDYDDKLANADYVWVHHQVIPLKILRTVHSPTKFIFLHMSALREIYLEQPYVYDLENRLSSKTLFMAPEAKQLAKDVYFNFDKLDNSDIFPNPVPSEFLKPCLKKEKLRSILIVSNHPTEEASKACIWLKEQGITTHLLGETGKPELISPRILDEHDLIITVAKSVQYCLTMGIPVYIYDHFGGPGYLNAKNFEKTAFNNFSGRGFSKKSAEEIANEIIKGYDAALKFQTENRDKFAIEYSLENNLKRVFKDLRPVKIEPFSSRYLNYVESIEHLAAGKIIGENVAGDLNRELALANSRAEKYQKEHENLLNSRTVKTVNRLSKFIKRKN